ncbi:hypothetical protein [Mucispirillum schaedleri]|jgi:energy-converting hydrogenase Eha subunit E|uniref:Uncharacterized protein n=1 Tax=Mucispirillum schaedleri ASF457 TaxID=1379858 RepID=V2QDC8_9BACT|nr:hypothetical protein [Mucispirillum schaedleri]MCX4360407.1 hypothetical protein [Mucispirillum schaedleri]USF24182.1 hypothetical protein N508_001264 [Mucispirillum schaedleri ASF457]SIW06120.1 conserved hypothetical protein [Mucispirillum schaedleri ASF457]
MDNKYILISLNYFEISIVTLVLLYTFLNTEKKYFTKIIVSAINKLILWLRSIVKNKKYNQDNKSDDMEEK